MGHIRWHQYILLPFLMCVSLLARVNTHDPIRFETINISHGLAQNSVMAIAQDKYGFMWFGTEDGLDRFDGIEFVHHRNQPINPHSLNSSSIQSLLVDSTGDLWVATYASGLNKYRYETEDFIRFIPDTSQGFTQSTGPIYDMIEDHSGALWLGSEYGGLIHFDPQTAVFTPIQSLLTPGDTLSSPIILKIMEDHLQRLWIATAEGLHRFDPHTKQLRTYRNDPNDPSSIFADYITTIFESFDGDTYAVWVASSWGGFDRYDPDSDGFTHHGYGSSTNPNFPENDVLTVMQESPDRIWLGTNGKGVLLVDGNGKISQHLERKLYDAGALQDNIIECITYSDKHIWVGTLGGGVSKYDPNAKRFFNITYDPLNPKGLHDNRILTIDGNSEGQLWIATWTEGLTLYDLSSQEFKPFLSDPNDPHSLSTNDIQDILVDSHDNLWVSSGYPNLDVLYAGEDAFHQILGSADPSNGFMADYIVSFLEDKQGYIWMGTWAEGLIRLDPSDMTFTSFKEPSVGDITLGSMTGYVLYEDSRDMLWIGAENNGLVGFDRSANTLIQYLASPGDPHTLPNNDVLCFYEDADSIIWMGSYGGGLTRFDPQNRTFESYSKPAGLLSDVIYKIFDSADGYLWMSTNKGLSRFHKRKGTFENFGIADGIISEEFNPAGYQSPEGILYFGGVSGITYFDPKTIKRNQNLPRVHFTQLSIMNQTIGVKTIYDDRIVLDRSLLTLPEIILTSHDLMFGVQVAGLEYSHPSSNQISYLLEGFDEDWRNLGTQRKISFTNLPPGNYTLKVKGSNNDDNWTDRSTDLAIRILPAFYETWWFIAAIILGLLVTLWGVYRYRTLLLIKEGERLSAHNIKLNAEIQSRREAHRFAREKAEYFRAVISQSPVPMAIHNMDGHITHLNKGWQSLWGVSDPRDIVSHYQVHSDSLAQKMGLGKYFEKALMGNIVELSELMYLDMDSREKVVHLLLYPLKSSEGVTNQVMISINDITEIVSHRHFIEKSLKEKELLLKEVHHRVKNNLQIIASLLGLQKEGTNDEGVGRVLDEFKNRVNSMALVHDALYRSPEFDEIDISTYIHGLLTDLRQAYEHGSTQVQIGTDIPSLTLTVDIAVPCGLIINELVTNALKYAFNDDSDGENLITVSFTEMENNWLRLEVSDNGQGFQGPLEWDSIGSLGLYLVKILAEGQLMGSVTANNENGASIRIEFPLAPDFD